MPSNGCRYYLFYCPCSSFQSLVLSSPLFLSVSAACHSLSSIQHSTLLNISLPFFLNSECLPSPLTFLPAVYVLLPYLQSPPSNVAISTCSLLQANFAISPPPSPEVGHTLSRPPKASLPPPNCALLVCPCLWSSSPTWLLGWALRLCRFPKLSIEFPCFWLW